MQQVAVIQDPRSLRAMLASIERTSNAACASSAIVTRLIV
jgi:hypothetical protein